MDLSPSQPDMVLQGKDGWLFLKNDRNNVLAQIAGKLELSRAGKISWFDEMEKRRSHARNLGYIYKTLIVPNKHCVYEEFLPDGIEVSPERIAFEIRDIAPDIVDYPIDFFRENKDIQLYHKTDTHWTQAGCVAYMNTVAASMGSRPMGWNVVEIDIGGDLGSKLHPGKLFKSVAISYQDNAIKIHDNKIKNLGHVIITENSDTSLPVAVIFGDSFFTDYIKIIAQFFKKLYYFHAPCFDDEIIEKIKPHVVINENVERFMVPEGPDKLKLSEHFYSKFFGRDWSQVNNIKTSNNSRQHILDLEHDLMDDWISKLMAVASEEDFYRVHLDYYLKNKIARLIPNKNIFFASKKRPYQKTACLPTQETKFTGWAVGYIHDASFSPRAVSFNVFGLEPEGQLHFDVYECDRNSPDLNVAELPRLYHRSWQTRELQLIQGRGAIYLSVPGLCLEAYKSYLFTLRVDPGYTLGIGQSFIDYLFPQFFFRGYYEIDNDGLFHVLVKRYSIAFTIF